MPGLPEISGDLKDRYFLNKRRCFVQKFKFGRHFDESIDQLRRLAEFLSRALGARFNRLVGDFVRGNSGRLCLFNVKGYRVESPLSELRMKVKITHRGGV